MLRKIWSAAKRSFLILDGGITVLELMFVVFLFVLALLGVLEWIGAGVGLLD